MSEKKKVLNNKKKVNLFEIIKNEKNLENKNTNIFSVEEQLEEIKLKKEEKKNIFLSKKTFHFKTDKISDNLNKKPDNIIINEGRWSKEENDKFLEGIELFGINWKKVKKLIDTRTIIQVRSHAQKFYYRMKLCKDDSLGINFTLKSICNIKDMINHIKSINYNYNIKKIFNHLSYNYEKNEKDKKKYIKNNKKSKNNNFLKNIINLQEENSYNNSNIFQNNEVNLKNIEKKFNFNKNIQNYNQTQQNNNNLLLNNKSYIDYNYYDNNNRFNNSFINQNFFNNENFINNNNFNNNKNIGNSLINDYSCNTSYSLLSNYLNYSNNNNMDKNILLINNLFNQNYNNLYYNSLPTFDGLYITIIKQ